LLQKALKGSRIYCRKKLLFSIGGNHTVTVTAPEYYLDFSCKCGECRHVCCRDWGIAVSEREYFRLIGLECTKPLRRRIDCAFCRADSPDSERYALMAPDFLGNCHLLREDGYCALQKECGEMTLPLICRQYPRSVRVYGKSTEICTSNSCEKTLELLYADTKPVRMTTFDADLTFDGIKIYGDEPEKDSIRRKTTDIMSDRALSFDERLREVGKYICPGQAPASITDGETLEAACRFIQAFEERSAGIAEYGAHALEYLYAESCNASYERYVQAQEHLKSTIPSSDVFFEKVAVNHMIYESFPFVPGSASVEDAFVSFSFAMLLTKLICSCCFAEKKEAGELIDVTAEAFRFFEHSGYYSMRLRKLRVAPIRQ